jgi:hypothetical protein
MPRWEPPREQVVEKPKPRRWPAVVLLLAILAVAGYGLWMMMRRLHPAPRQLAAAAAGVRSSITAAGDSLEVGVSWEFRPGAGGVPDSMRVEVGRGDGSEARAHVIGGESAQRYPASGAAHRGRDGERLFLRGRRACGPPRARELHALAVRAALG